ncbi:hypothetical protein [Campylobacter concisus]|jgi:hypothetical protein
MKKIAYMYQDLFLKNRSSISKMFYFMPNNQNIFLISEEFLKDINKENYAGDRIFEIDFSSIKQFESHCYDIASICNDIDVLVIKFCQLGSREINYMHEKILMNTIDSDANILFVSSKYNFDLFLKSIVPKIFMKRNCSFGWAFIISIINYIFSDTISILNKIAHKIKYKTKI